MNQFTKLLCCYCSLIVSYYLYADSLASSVPQSSQHYIEQLSQPRRSLLLFGYSKQSGDIPHVIHMLMLYFLHDHPLQYKGKKLPRSLSGQDLTGFNFTGCDFSYTDMRNTNLTNASLSSTTCEYQKFIKSNGGTLLSSSFFTNQLSVIPSAILKHLRKISYVYPKLSSNTQKAKLVHIASGLTELWFDLLKESRNSVGISKSKEQEYTVQIYSYFFSLWMLKEELQTHQLKKELTFFLETTFNVTSYYSCWTSTYSGNKWKRDHQGDLQNMKLYPIDFLQGIIEYNKEKKEYYYDRIQKSILELYKLYPKIQDKQMQQEACNIACGLSKSYQFSKAELFEWYLYWLKRLMRFKNHKLNAVLEKDITYTPLPFPVQITSLYHSWEQ